MEFTGLNNIGYSQSGLGDEKFKAFAPMADSFLSGDFVMATRGEFEEALTLAETAFIPYRQTITTQRATFLDAIADEIMALGDDLLTRCAAESGLPLGRITGERGRTCGQLKMFAQLIRDGWYVDARIDTAMPERQPLPKSDIRRMLIPLGPVAVFGASNFPLAFSTAGGDMASALAAGCPVVVKAHPSHPGTNEMISLAIIKAAQKTGMPDGVFSSLYLNNNDAIKLVEHPVIKAVGFTGSRSVGMKLFYAAVARPEPIPVYAEMSAVNPVVLLPEALKTGADSIAKNLAASVTMGAGQFCTNPGLVLMVNDEAAQNFLIKFAEAISQTAPATMLNKNICKAYQADTAALSNAAAVTMLGQSAKEADAQRYEARPAAFTVKAADFMANSAFGHEVFGPSTLVVLCDDHKELLGVLNGLEGQLTATLHANTADAVTATAVIEAVSQKAGRVIYGGYPTGVEVCHAMQHGGPFPSTTDARSTSVGTAAIYRFLRPVSFQDLPDSLLPPALQNDNPLAIVRLVDGRWTSDKTGK